MSDCCANRLKGLWVSDHCLDTLLKRIPVCGRQRVPNPLQHSYLLCRSPVNRLQRDVLIERHQRAVVFDRERQQIKIGDLVMSVDAREIHG